jgi:hypothetical protein
VRNCIVGSCHCQVVGFGKLKPPTSITVASLVALLRGHVGAAPTAPFAAAPGAGALLDPAGAGDCAAGGRGPAGAGGLGFASLHAAIASEARSEARSTIRRSFMLLG